RRCRQHSPRNRLAQRELLAQVGRRRKLQCSQRRCAKRLFTDLADNLRVAPLASRIQRGIPSFDSIGRYLPTVVDIDCHRRMILEFDSESSYHAEMPGALAARPD